MAGKHSDGELKKRIRSGQVSREDVVRRLAELAFGRANDCVKLVLELGVAEPVLRSITEKVGAEELMKLKSALEKRMEESLPMTRQLGSWEDREDAVESGFLI